MKPADLIAIITYTDATRVLDDFTDNRDDLLMAINKLVIGEARS